MIVVGSTPARSAGVDRRVLAAQQPGPDLSEGERETASRDGLHCCSETSRLGHQDRFLVLPEASRMSRNHNPDLWR
jgi:hypothetical protein